MSFLKNIFGGWRNAHYAQGIRHFNRREFRRALREFNQVIENKHMSLDAELARFYAAEAHVRLGLDFFRKHDYTRARQEFESAVLVEGTSPDLFFYLSVLALRQEDFTESLAHAARTVVLSPHHVSAIACVAVSARELGNRESMTRALDRLKECSFPLPPSTYLPPRGLKSVHLLPALKFGEVRNESLHLAFRHHAAGMLPEALVALELALEETPDYPDLLLFQGRLLSDLQRDQEAVGAFERALQRNPHLVDAYLAKGLSLLSLNRPEAALECLSQGAQLRPEFADIAFYQGVAAYRSGLSREATGMLQRALRVNPGFWQAHFVVGQMYSHLGDHDLAVDHLARALEEMCPAPRAPGRVEGVKEKTGTMLQVALAHHPDYPDLRVHLALDLFESGDAEAARRELMYAVRLHPGYAQAHAYLGKLEIHAERPRAAVPHLEMALSLKPRYADLQVLLGEALLATGDVSGAAGAFRAAIDLNPQSHSGLVGLAEVRSRQKRHTEARELLNRASGIPVNGRLTAEKGQRSKGSGLEQPLTGTSS